MSIEHAVPSAVVPRSRAVGWGGVVGHIQARVMVCVGLLALLMVWPVIFPQTGDGDAVMHFLNAHDSLWQPYKLMGSWARVGAKIPLLIPAQFGVLGARWASAVISIVCAWQTIRLADDLKIQNGALAGVFLIFQPFVFSLAGDTMTELPLALGIVAAIRLWLSGRVWASCWVVGYLPTVRPEGFFLVVLWGAMVLGTGRLKSAGRKWGRRVALVGVLGWGTLAWFFGCWILWGNPTYFFRAGWSWPADSLRVYGHGSFFAHVNRWPIYCGPILLVLFLVGAVKGALSVGSRMVWILGFAVVLLILELVVPAAIRENILPWSVLALMGATAWEIRGRKFAIGVWVFLLVFTLHSVLWWRGWFGSCGLMRILACVSPITAIVCLRAWNVIAGRLKPIVRVAGIAAIAATAMIYYVIDPLHQRIFPLERACAFVAEHQLLRGAPMIIFGDPMAQAALRMEPNPQNLVMNDCDPAKEREHLRRAPVGSVGLWDNQHAMAWFGVSISELPGLGYSVIFKTDRVARFGIEWLEPANVPRDQEYVVIRKDK
jgi:hypothetical protein